MSAEMEARKTAAAAVLGDFRSAALNWPATPDYVGWALRLAGELGSVLEQLAAEPDASAQVQQIHAVLDAVLSTDTADRQYALEQIDDILRGDR